jgi:type II secretory pathway pseudopilin PulG
MKIQRRKKTSGSFSLSGIQSGFTLVETIMACIVMIILCVGLFTVFDHVIRLNRGNDIRSQALTVLQKEVEFYRALKYVPVGSDPLLDGHSLITTRTNVPSADGTLFDIDVTVDNDPYTAGIQTSADGGEADCRFKEITITARPSNAQTGWLADLKTKIVFQRVRLID